MSDEFPDVICSAHISSLCGNVSCVVKPLPARKAGSSFRLESSRLKKMIKKSAFMVIDTATIESVPTLFTYCLPDQVDEAVKMLHEELKTRCLMQYIRAKEIYDSSLKEIVITKY